MDTKLVRLAFFANGVRGGPHMPQGSRDLSTTKNVSGLQGRFLTGVVVHTSRQYYYDSITVLGNINRPGAANTKEHKKGQRGPRIRPLSRGDLIVCPHCIATTLLRTLRLVCRQLYPATDT